MARAVARFSKSIGKVGSGNYLLSCKGSSCDVADTCPFMEEGSVCRVHKEYLTNVINLICRHEETGVLDEQKMHIIGTTLLPLYTHLFRFQVAEMALTTPVCYGKTVYVHPIYKEIRNTSKLIYDMWLALGFVGKAPIPSKEEGSTSIYDIMTEAEEAEKKEAEGTSIDEDLEDVFESAKAIRKEGTRKSKVEEVNNAFEAVKDVVSSFNADGEEDEGQVEEGFDPRNLPLGQSVDIESIKEGE